MYEAVESFDQRYVYVGRFSNAFRELFKGKDVVINDYPIAMNYRDAYLSMHSKETGKYHGNGINYHNLGVGGLESALTSFESPKAIMMSKKQGKIELVLQGVDKKGKTLLSIVAINTKTQNNRKFLDAHIVTSVYGKKSIEKYISNAENEGRLLLTKEEETSQGIPQVQYEGNINEISSDNSIHTSLSKSQEKFSDREIGYGKLTQNRIDYLIEDKASEIKVLQAEYRR